MRLRSAVVTAVFNKALVLSTGAMSRRTTGEISNIMSVDSTRLQDLTPYLHAVWYSFFQITIALYLLWQQVGAASIAGVVIIILTIPLIERVSSFMKFTQKQLSSARDERIKVSNEVLSGMKVIKVQAWEKNYEDKINTIREKELKLFRKYVVMQSLSGALFTTIPLLVAISTFVSYIAMGNKLDVATALTSLALFELLRFPLFMLPNVMNNCVEAKVSVDRVQSILMEPEHEHVPVHPLKSYGVMMKKATLVWDTVGKKKISVDDMEALKRSKQTMLGRVIANAKDLLQVVGAKLGVYAAPAARSTTKTAGEVTVNMTREEHLMHVFQAQAHEAENRIEELELELTHTRALNLRTNSALEVAVDIGHSADEETTESESPLLKHPLGTFDDNHNNLKSPDTAVIDFDKDDDSEGGEGKEGLVDCQMGPDRVLTLSRVSLRAGPGDLIAIVGQVGSGKSSILSGLLGDLQCFFGRVAKRGRVAYVSQRPFIQNSTLKDNITFGMGIDEDRYNAALADSALLPDLKVLPAGDQTEIGERGINLSGGQKARVSLARAIYADSDVYLLDDCLAAVDAHVGQHLFENCILKLQEKGKCVILVTNAVQFLRNVTRVLVVRNGRIVETGSYEQLMAAGSYFKDMISAHQDSVSDAMALNRNDSASPSNIDTWTTVSFSGAVDAAADKKKSVATVSNPLHDKTKSSSEEKTPVTAAVKPSAGALMTQEDREVGNVDSKVYKTWLHAAGGMSVGAVLLVLYYGGEAIAVMASWWLTYWSQHTTATSPQSESWYYLGIYILINIGVAFFMFVRELYVRIRSLHAGRTLFQSLITSVLHAPMSFFDTTPLGRIINRFSKDMYTVDEQIPQTVRWYLASMAKVTGVLVYICIITPLFILVLIPICFCYVLAQRYYIKTSRELTRLDSTSRSPIYALFSETLDGLSTIRAYRSEERFRSRNCKLLDDNQQAYFLNFSANCWLAVRLELVGTLIVTFAALFAVLARDSMNSATASPDLGATSPNDKQAAFAGLAGLAISLALSVTQSLNWTVRMASDLESQMVSVERVKRYTLMEQEAPHFAPQTDPPRNWPISGAIEIHDVSMRYRENLPLVLNGVTLSIAAKDKIGICGRTGAGKSSLLTVLLRLVEFETGSIVVDGVDITSIGLHALRSKMAVIPQDPVLFSGDIRSNLDPFGQFTDGQVWDGLRRTHSSGFVATLSDKVEENGGNFSVGQRQLLCISRALLSKARIIIMDEATAAVDVETDAWIQNAIRQEFADSTCLTVAHRLNTIMDSDKVLVMDHGRVAEFDKPSVLLADPSSMFSALVANWESSNQ